MVVICRLSALMAAKGVRLQDVHRATGIGRSVLTEMRDNKRVRYDVGVMERLCDYFGCPLADLITRTPDPDKPTPAA